MCSGPSHSLDKLAHNVHKDLGPVEVREVHAVADQLALAAAVMLARRLDLATVLGYLRTVQTFFETLFPHLEITSIAEWDAGRAMRASLRCEVPKVHTLEQRLRFWSTYTSISNHEHIWLARLPEEDRRRYQVFVLPRV